MRFRAVSLKIEHPTCSVCNKDVYAKGYCFYHYTQCIPEQHAKFREYQRKWIKKKTAPRRKAYRTKVLNNYYDRIDEKAKKIAARLAKNIGNCPRCMELRERIIQGKTRGQYSFGYCKKCYNTLYVNDMRKSKREEKVQA